MSPQVELYLLVVSVCSLLHNTFHSVPLLDFCGHLLCIVSTCLQSRCDATNNMICEQKKLFGNIAQSHYIWK